MNPGNTCKHTTIFTPHQHEILEGLLLSDASVYLSPRSVMEFMGKPELECFAYKWKTPTTNGIHFGSWPGEEHTMQIIENLANLGRSDLRIAKHLTQTELPNRSGSTSWRQGQIRNIRLSHHLPPSPYKTGQNEGVA